MSGIQKRTNSEDTIFEIPNLSISTESNELQTTSQDMLSMSTSHPSLSLELREYHANVYSEFDKSLLHMARTGWHLASARYNKTEIMNRVAAAIHVVFGERSTQEITVQSMELLCIAGARIALMESGEERTDLRKYFLLLSESCL